jgi:hypothetical protein
MTYICKTCRFVTTTKNTYNTHLISKKHKEKNPNETTPPLIMDGSNNTLYECKSCNFSTFVKSAYKKHENSKKHAENSKTCIPCAPTVEKISENKHQIENTAPNHKNKDSIVENHQHGFHVNTEMCEKEKRKRFKHHMGALRLLQELSSGKISENDIAAYMQKHHPGANTSDDDDDDDHDDDAASIQDNKDLSSKSDETENMYQNVSGFQNQENSDEPETFTFYINGPSESPVPVPHVRHQPYYFDFPPETPAGRLPDPPADYKLPTFIENRRKTVEANDPELEAKQFNDIRQFIIDFLNGTQNRMGPDAERFRWQLNEITKLFIHNNMNTIQNRQNLPGTI